MGKTLDKLVTARIVQLFPEFEKGFDVSDPEKEDVAVKLQSTLTQEVREEIKAELLEEEIATMKARVSQEEATLRHSSLIQNIKTLFLDGFLIALLVGLVVNQVTDIFSYFKTGNGNIPFTLLLIFILLVLIFLLVQYRLCDAILNFKAKRDTNK